LKERKVAKDGKGKKSKAGKAKVPKEIGGVKVPKKLRKLGSQAAKAVKDPAVTEVVAGALLAAAAALREGKDPKTVVGAAMKNGFKSATAGAGNAGGPRLSDTLKLLAMDLAKRTLDGIGEKQAQRASAAPHETAPAPAAGAGEVRADPAPEAPPQPRAPRKNRAPAAG
jgi:hypothetical protein